MAAIHQISSDFAPISTLPPAQAQVVAALAKGQTITAAAAEAGIHRTTIHHWLRTEPDFKTAVETAQREHISSLNDEMRALSALALAALRSLLEDPSTPPSIRLKAALAVLQRENLPNKTWSLSPSASNRPNTRMSSTTWRKSYRLKAIQKTSQAGQDQAANRPPRETEPAPRAVHHLTYPYRPPFARSAPCPCGSGLNYKRCCGAASPGVFILPKPRNATTSA